jgi:opacity protein-like surface antigen
MNVVKTVVVAMAMVCLLFTSVQAKPYVGFQLGPNFTVGSGTELNGVSTYNPKFETGMMFGAQAGYDFNTDQFKFPTWAKYFTVAIDYQYNGLYLSNNKFSSNSKGSQNAVAILGIVKLSLMTSKEYPRGRLFPYVGAGPSLVWTSIGNRTSTNIGLVAEPGVRYMFTPKFSGDVAYRFTHARPGFYEDGNKVSTSINNHAVVFRVNYHF